MSKAFNDFWANEAFHFHEERDLAKAAWDAALEVAAGFAQHEALIHLRILEMKAGPGP